jgi:hypothetical protein
MTHKQCLCLNNTSHICEQIPEGAVPQEFIAERSVTPQCNSFMHVHLGLRAEDIPAGSIDCHYALVGSWEVPIDAAGNVVIVSIPR